MTVEKIRARMRETADNIQSLAASAEVIEAAAAAMCRALAAGNKIIFCGNGGSAADSQHLAAELMGRFLRDRAPLPALALTTDTSALTAIANDYSFAEVFSRQIRAIGRGGDVLIAISTSGNSANVLQAAHAARDSNIAVIALTGADGGELANMADIAIKAPAQRTDLIQEMHIVIGHILCGLAEDAMQRD